MLAQKFSKTFDIGDGREVTIETGRLARQADGAVTVKIGNCFLLATVCATEKTQGRPGFFFRFQWIIWKNFLQPGVFQALSLKGKAA